MSWSARTPAACCRSRRACARRARRFPSCTSRASLTTPIPRAAPSTIVKRSSGPSVKQRPHFHEKMDAAMSVSRSTYRHRLGSEDVRKARILITKDAWKLFPNPGERVALRIGARRFDAEIISERCVCVPPEHEHYHLVCPALKGQSGFKKDALVVIAKDSDGGYRFVEGRGYTRARGGDPDRHPHPRLRIRPRRVRRRRPRRARVLRLAPR